MPARSKAQQRLMGMVHAYNKGEFHGSKSLTKLVAGISRGMSDADVGHFARTPHDGLPEKVEKDAQYMMIDPTQARQALTALQSGVSRTVDDGHDDEDLLSRVKRRAVVGSALGGLILGGLGAVAHNAVAKSEFRPANEVSLWTWGSGAKNGLLGALYGGLLGAGIGGAEHLVHSIRGK